MLRLKTLKISNVGRFVGDHEIVFDGRPYLIQVDGKNLNTGGSSGSAKSTVFNSLDYLLGTNQLPSTVLQSRLTKNPMSVSGVFDLDGKTLEISRSKSGGLSIFLDSVPVATGSSKVAEEKLDEILGIPRELLRKMMHKRQKEGGFFLGLTPKECHAFLAEALDLKSWSSRLQRAISDQSIWEKKMATTKAAIEASQQSLTVSRNSLATLVAPSIDWDRSLLEILKTNVEKAEKALSEENLKLEAELKSVPRPATPPPVSRQSLLPLQEQVKQLKAQEAFEKKKITDQIQEENNKKHELISKLKTYKDAVMSLQVHEKKIESIKQEIMSIKNSTCYTCKQPWHTSGDELNALIEKAKNEALKIQNIKNLEGEIPSLEEALKNKEKDIELLKSASVGKDIADAITKAELAIFLETQKIDNLSNAQNKSYGEDMKRAQEIEAEIKQKYSQSTSALAYNLDQHRSLYTQKKAELNSYEQNLSLFNSNQRSLNNGIEELEKNLTSLIGEHQEADTMYSVSSSAVKVIKSYMNTLFQDALDSIASKATDILSRIPNMSTATVYFEGFKETKSGVVKDEVSAIITMDGEIGIPVKSMSGGERTAIDLAIDLAVIDMVEERAGKGLDIFILDEPFDGLDSVCREQCLEILKTHVSGKRIIIVDHSNETKELVHDRIFVIRDGQQSTISDSVS